MSKAKKKTKKAKKQNSSTKQEAKKGYDKFGRRLNTQGALIDEHLSQKGKTVEQLAKECKLPKGRISTHVRDLLGKGFIKKTKDGYSIK